MGVTVAVSAVVGAAVGAAAVAVPAHLHRRLRGRPALRARAVPRRVLLGGGACLSAKRTSFMRSVTVVSILSTAVCSWSS